MKTAITLFTLLLMGMISNAQTEKVFFTYSENTFDGNMPLPAEDKFMIQGRIAPEVTLVDVSVFKNIDSKRNALYTAYWRRGQDKQADAFSVMMHQKLRQSTEYDFLIKYYRITTKEETDYTLSELRNQITLYLNNNAVQDGKKWIWSKNSSALIGDMNNIINDGLSRFTNGEGEKFEGFSDNVNITLDNLKNHTIKLSKKDSVRLLSDDAAYFNTLADQLTNEVQHYLQGEIHYAFDQREVLRYSTEDLKNILAISAGYGGVIFNEKKNNENYGHAPYVGLSVPFGNRAMSKPFWSNLSLSTGVFLLNFEDKDGNKVSGPIIQRPLYVGLGYKFLRFVKVQGGITMLETQVEEGGFVNFDQVYFRPYVGIGLEFNFWMDFAK